MPDSDEQASLQDHAKEVEQLTIADRFLFELSKATRFKQRLKTLLYKKRFTTSMDDIGPKIKAVLEASLEIQRSEKLKVILQIILALGNYLNSGPRGNAKGIKIKSLTTIADTKSSCQTEKDSNLLHFIAETCKEKFTECISVEEDLAHLRIASKVNLMELEKDINLLCRGMTECEKEAEFFRGDDNLPVIHEFIQAASIRLSKLKKKYTDMKAEFGNVCFLFCEDPAAGDTQEAFFKNFEEFISSFVKAKMDIDHKQK